MGGCGEQDGELLEAELGGLVPEDLAGVVGVVLVYDHVSVG